MTADLEAKAYAIVSRFISPMNAKLLLARVSRDADTRVWIRHLCERARVFVGEATGAKLLDELSSALTVAREPETITFELSREDDVQVTRLAARDLCRKVGASPLVAQKAATAVSELSRNVTLYVGHGKLELRTTFSPRAKLTVHCEDAGPGIANLDAVLRGTYKSKTGLGRGLLGVKQLADGFSIDSSANGTRIETFFYLE